MHEGGVCLHRRQRVDDRRQRCIVHLDQLPGILGQGQILGHNNGDGLPDVTHLAARQDRMDGRLQFLCFCFPPGRYGFDHPLEVICGDNCDHPRRVTSRRRLDRRDAGVRVGAAEHRGVEHALER